VPVLVVRLEPWLAGQTFLGEPVPERWRRIGAEAGFDVRIEGPGGEGGDAVVDGSVLTLDADELRSLGEGLALVLEEPSEEDDEETEFDPDHGLVVAAPADRSFLVGQHDVAGGTRPLLLFLGSHPVRSHDQLAHLEAFHGRMRRDHEQKAGVRLIGGGQFLSPTVTLEPGCTLGPNVVLLGVTRVAAGAVIQMGCHLVDTEVGPGALLKPYTVAEGARIGAGAVVGPFAHLREGSVLGDGAHLGNFVETKKAVLGAGAKANHLAYLGDCTVGARTNIGAGTITCNYDGARKHHTEIGDDVFVGTNSSLVAPLTIGEGALIAAGSVVVQDVPAGALVVARGEQRTTAEKGRAILARNRRLKAEGQ
jgi:acetyltransferase-like isoleucine patch superfamily enzyme